jgi:hypothetical protein
MEQARWLYRLVSRRDAELNIFDDIGERGDIEAI